MNNLNCVCCPKMCCLPISSFSIPLYRSYDFGYLVKLLTDTHLPPSETEFHEYYQLYFPAIYDVKYLMKSVKQLKGGLQDVALMLEVGRNLT